VDLKISAKGASNLVIKRFMGPFWKYRRWLDKSQWFYEEQFQNIQAKLLRQLISHCYETVPFYRQFMNKHSIKPADIRKSEDLNLFPVLTKKMYLKPVTCYIPLSIQNGLFVQLTPAELPEPHFL